MRFVELYIKKTQYSKDFLDSPNLKKEHIDSGCFSGSSHKYFRYMWFLI